MAIDMKKVSSMVAATVFTFVVTFALTSNSPIGGKYGLLHAEDEPNCGMNKEPGSGGNKVCTGKCASGKCGKFKCILSHTCKEVGKGRKKHWEWTPDRDVYVCKCECTGEPKEPTDACNAATTPKTRS